MSSGYVSESVRQSVREAFGNRCAYCLSSQRYTNSKLEIEHIIPKAIGGSDDELNLCLACRLCNSYKSIQTEAVDPTSNAVVPLFNPRTQAWSEHFQWSRDGVRVIGLSVIGRATVEALQLNNETAVNVRRNWVSVGWHPPDGLN
ncbi:MAG: HNH endonuclease [Acidobacteriota bacterium]|nr:HNH endonuclease [Acidobacteriota bacterium]